MVNFTVDFRVISPYGLVKFKMASKVIYSVSGDHCLLLIGVIQCMDLLVYLYL